MCVSSTGIIELIMRQSECGSLVDRESVGGVTVGNVSISNEAVCHVQEVGRIVGLRYIVNGGPWRGASIYYACK